MDREYSKRELDMKLEEIHERFDRSDQSDEKILAQVTYTNGKLRKVIMALIIISSVVVTLLIQNGSKFAEFLIGIIK